MAKHASQAWVILAMPDDLLTKGERLTLARMHMLDNGRLGCTASAATLGEDTGQAAASVETIRRKLQDGGIVEHVRGSWGWHVLIPDDCLPTRHDPSQEEKARCRLALKVWLRPKAQIPAPKQGSRVPLPSNKLPQIPASRLHNPSNLTETSQQDAKQIPAPKQGSEEPTSQRRSRGVVKETPSRQPDGPTALQALSSWDSCEPKPQSYEHPLGPNGTPATADAGRGAHAQHESTAQPARRRYPNYTADDLAKLDAPTREAVLKVIAARKRLEPDENTAREPELGEDVELPADLEEPDDGLPF